MAANPSSLLQALHENLVAASSRGRECFDVGPFRVMITPDSDFKWSNIATPIRPGYTAADVESLSQAMRERQRLPRLEIISDLWPDLPPLLESCGFVLEHRLPLMVTTSDAYRQPASIGRGRVLSPDDELGEAWMTETRAFGNPQPVDEDRLARRRERMRGGYMSVGVAREEGVLAASALLMTEGRVAELAGVGTLPEYRGRGLAGDASAVLIESFFARGGEVVWLSSADDIARRTYSKLGFEEVGVQMNYSAPEPTP